MESALDVAGAGAAAMSTTLSVTGATALSVTLAVTGATCRNPRYLSHMASYDDDVASSIWQARPRKEEKLSARGAPGPGECCSRTQGRDLSTDCLLTVHPSTPLSTGAAAALLGAGQGRARQY